MLATAATLVTNAMGASFLDDILFGSYCWHWEMVAYLEFHAGARLASLVCQFHTTLCHAAHSGIVRVKIHTHWSHLAHVGHLYDPRFGYINLGLRTYLSHQWLSPAHLMRVPTYVVWCHSNQAQWQCSNQACITASASASRRLHARFERATVKVNESAVLFTSEWSRLCSHPQQSKVQRPFSNAPVCTHLQTDQDLV